MLLNSLYENYMENYDLVEKEGWITSPEGVELMISTKGNYINLIKYEGNHSNKFGGQILVDEQDSSTLYVTPENNDGEFTKVKTIEEAIKVFQTL